MSDFDSQQQLWQWLSEDNTRRVRHYGNDDGYTVGFLSYCGLHVINSKGIPCEKNRDNFYDFKNWRKVKPKVTYLKSMEQILTEFSVTFDTDGRLKILNSVSGGHYFIPPTYFHKLGSPCDDGFFPHWLLEEKEIEE